MGRCYRKIVTECQSEIKILLNGKKLPGRHFLQCHVVFSVKMEDFRHKAKLMVIGHMTKAPATIMYASVVSRQIVRITLMIDANSDFEVSFLTS